MKKQQLTSQDQKLSGGVQHLVNQLAAAGSNDFFDILTREIAQTLDIKYCYVSQYLDPECSRARLLSNWNGDGHGPTVEYETADTPCDDVWNSPVTLYPSGVKKLFPKDKFLQKLDAECYLAVPFSDLDGLPLGHVCIMDNKPMDRSIFSEMVLTIISLRVAAEVQRYKYEKYLLQSAMYDPLTDLLNRTFLWDRLEQAVNHTFRNDSIVGVVFIDLDDFKSINDSHGHDAGDAVLIHTAEIIRSTIRKTDSACRFGGDEFLIVIEDTIDEQAVINVAHNIHSRLNRTTCKLGNDSITLSASVGVALCPEDSTDPRELVRIADTAMYQAKRHDKSIVVH